MADLRNSVTDAPENGEWIAAAFFMILGGGYAFYQLLAVLYYVFELSGGPVPGAIG